MEPKNKILLVEDAPQVLSATVHLLKQSGYHVTEARTGEAALQAAKNDMPDLILLDVVLPDMNGLDICHALKAAPETAGIFICIVSGQKTSASDLSDGLDIGGDEYITRPIGNRELLARINAMFRLIHAENKIKQILNQCENIVEEKTIGLKKEIIKRKKNEAQLLASQKDWEDIFQAIGHPTLILDPAHRILKANNASLSLIKAQADQFIGKKCFELFHHTNHPPSSCPMEKLLHEGTVHTIEMEMEAVGKPFLVSCTPITDTNGRLQKIIHIASDITETKKLEAALRRRQKMEALGTLCGGIAHEFNNMLTIILGNAELAADEIPSAHPIAECLEDIRKASLRAKGVVEKLLSFSQKNPTGKKPVALDKIIEKALYLLKQSTPEPLDIKKTLHCKNAMILANEKEIHQVLSNLCANAIHAMKDNPGQLEVNLENIHIPSQTAEQNKELQTGNYFRLSIRDTGQGIDADIIERIFDPYFTTKPMEEGLGMGLAVVLGIVKKHQGAININSQVGKGTIVEVLFPMIEIKAEKKTEKPDLLPEGSERILIVDDEAAIVKMVRQMLERFGYEVDAETSGPAALSLFLENPVQYDLIISDLVMPEMSGDTLVQEILRIRPDIPVILCTGHSHFDRQHAESMGIRAYAMKPLQMGELLKMVRNVLNGSHL